jgi:hypothetical protein
MILFTWLTDKGQFYILPRSLKCSFLFYALMYVNYRWKSAITFISFISPVSLDIFFLHVVQIFQQDVICIPVYSGDSLCENVHHIWNYITVL